MYIGISKDVQKRWAWHGKKYDRCPHFWNAIQKYGWDNFEHVVLIENVSLEMANIIERELIKKYKTQNKKYGYNVDGGGNGKYGMTGKNNSRSKLIYQYDLNGNFIKEWENAQIASKTLSIPASTIYQSCRGTFDKPKMAGGYIWSYIKTDKMEKYTPAIPYYSEKYSILQINRNFEIINRYPNIYHVKEPEYDKGSVTDCCKRKRLIHKDYFWCYEKDYNAENFKEYIYSNLKEKGNIYQKTICQCDFNGKILNEYSNSIYAEKSTGFKKYTILAWCKRPSHGFKSGYLWFYKIDYETNDIQKILKDLKPKINKFQNK